MQDVNRGILTSWARAWEEGLHGKSLLHFFGEPKTTLKAIYLFLKQPLLKCKYLGLFDTHMSVNEITSVHLSHLGWNKMQGQYKSG